MYPIIIYRIDSYSELGKFSKFVDVVSLTDKKLDMTIEILLAGLEVILNSFQYTAKIVQETDLIINIVEGSFPEFLCDIIISLLDFCLSFVSLFPWFRNLYKFYHIRVVALLSLE
jgi:hypothetical protein